MGRDLLLQQLRPGYIPRISQDMGGIRDYSTNSISTTVTRPIEVIRVYSSL